MFEWIRNLRKKSAKKYWVLANPLGGFDKAVDGDHVPTQEVTEQVLASIRSKQKFTLPVLRNFAARYYFTNEADRDAFFELCIKMKDSAKADSPVETPVTSPTSTDDFATWAAANPTRPQQVGNDDDFLATVMGEQASRPKTLPATLTGPGHAIGLRIENGEFLFVNRKLAKGEILTYATDAEIKAIAEGKNIEIAAARIFHDRAQAAKMQASLLKAGLKAKKQG